MSFSSPFLSGFGSYFEDIHDGPDDIIHVWSGGRHFVVDAHLLDERFPGIEREVYANGGELNLDELAINLFPDLRTYGISKKTITKCLRDLLGLFRPYGRVHNVGFEYALIKQLKNDLETDAFHLVRHAGLRKTRQHFAILALFARMMRSRHLASVLANFFCQYWDTILSDSHRYLLNEWGTSISLLINLVPPHIIHQCMSYLSGKRPGIMSVYHNSGYHDPRLDTVIELLSQIAEGDMGYDRGRRYRRNMLEYPAARAITAPPNFHHPRPPLRYLMPPSPLPTTDVDEIAIRQQMLEMKVNSLEDQVELEYR
ncbi:hypothetical protein P154DRAFT_580971 [Amniculicola lignicola CBS 123094]|uniref:Uncharacterized protein n=1 Tax=Amniculicola lignicola CBS 123094 TaxID=1392246 RepID=A0A6A5W0L8_9PLEO|nr:hypothetical protein P154DRAFT_580971 [Amniculicola lignicola CBS 123094]